MAESQNLQTAFTSGVLNPGLAARTDIQHYYQGMKRGINVIGVKEGGALARWGRQHIGVLMGNARQVEFAFNTEQDYVLHFGELTLEIYRNDELVTNINGSGNDFLVTPWTLAQALEMNFTQSADTLVLMHPDVETRTLVRGASHSTWTLATLVTENLPKFDFNDASSPVPTDHVVDLTFNGFSDGDRYKIELNNFETPEIVYSSTDTSANARRIKEELLLLPPTGFDVTSITVALTGGTTYRLTFTGESADAYEDMTGRNTDSTSASISYAVISTGSPRREEVISATRGWPVSGTFFESRLVFFGLKSLPQSILGTVIGGFFPFDFNIGTGLDDQGIFVTLNTNQVNAFRSAYPGRHLQAFTSGGEFYFPERPLTPAPAIPRQSKFGIAAGIPPQELDGATLFVSKDKRTIREYLFLWAEEAYNATSLTVLSSHLVSNIRDFSALTSTTDREDSYALVVNGDGTGAILNSLRAQDIAAWTEDNTRTGDKLQQVTVVGEAIYYVVERAVNGLTEYHLEKASFDTRLDAAKKVTTGLSTSMSGFDHLAGQTVQVLVDGAPIADKTVSAAGVITLDDAPLVSIEAGYFVPPIVETMPLEADFGGGAILGATKSLADIRIKVKDSLGIIANGDKIPETAAQAHLDDPTLAFTGILDVEDLGYTDDDLTITLTQDQPLPFHILALSAVLEVSSS